MKHIVFIIFILSTIVPNSYSSEICQELIVKVNNNLNNNSIPKELKESIINLRDAGIDASKNIALSESMGVNCEDLLTEALNKSSN